MFHHMNMSPNMNIPPDYNTVNSVSDLLNKPKKEQPTLKTNFNIHIIYNKIKEILDNNNEMCKYWTNDKGSVFGVSFRVGSDQLIPMIKTSFEISISENDGYNTVTFTNEIEECDQWTPLYNEFINKLKY